MAAALALVFAACGDNSSYDPRSNPDAGTIGQNGDAGPGPPKDPGLSLDAGIALTATITHTEIGFDLLAVDPAGTAYGLNLLGDDRELWSTRDGRVWKGPGRRNGSSFRIMTALSDGTLLADVMTGTGDAIARSTDHGATWTTVLDTGKYRAVTPHSFAELDGAAYYLEYQVSTIASTPINLWRSTDSGATWSVRYTFDGHRHGHGLALDPARHALWAYFGDSTVQSGAYRSTDGGETWTAVLAGTQDGDIVDAVVLPDGSLLCGQDISFLPPQPSIARIGIDGSITRYLTLPSPSYSTHAVGSGGYVVGATYEQGIDVSPVDWTRGSLWGSGDGEHWAKLLDVPRLDPTGDVRTDVYWELPSGELVVSVRNALGFDNGGVGYMLMRTKRQ
jgi:photosystem II stability/assembly factor-like uncharacterized protein